jgi:DNA-binding winged helix-turn-helix (wHTH) protein/tetratricopeptide (TPR) repeat protein/TolB-like protein
MAFRSDDRTCYEFDDFLVDPVRRLLLRGAEPVALTPKALSILLALLERPGEVVDKADLIEKVWGGAYVSEANLTQNVFSLRKSLGDRANESRFVVTVPGRGYSFAGDVRRSERSADAVDIPDIPDIPEIADIPEIPEIPEIVDAAEIPPPEPEPEAAPSPAPPLPARRPFFTARRVALLALGCLGALLLGFIHARRPREPAEAAGAAKRPTIAVMDFHNLSPKGETQWLQTAFPEMLTTELAAGGTMRVLRGETVAQAQRTLTFAPDGSLGRGDLERLHAILGADMVVVGTYLPIGGKIRLDVRVLRAPDADTVVSLAEVGTEPGLFDLVSRSGSRLRESLGVAALSPQQARQARALQPSSPAASRLYTDGRAKLRAFDPPAALKLLKQAVEADPDSAVIHSALSQTWTALGDDARAEEEARRAVDLSGSLPREERLAIEARLYQVSEQWDRASETYRSLLTFFPDEIEYGLQLADSLTAGGRGSEAAATLESLRKLPAPAGEDPRIDLAEARNARRLSDIPRQRRAAETAVAKGRRSGQTLVVSRALIYQGDALVKIGQPRQALELFREAGATAQKAGHQWEVGMAKANVAAALKSLGDLDGAEKSNEESLAIAQKLGSGVGIAAQLSGLGELHGERGEFREAQRLLEQAHSWYVEMGDRLMQAHTLNHLGAMLCAQGDLAGAGQRHQEALHLGQAMSNQAVEAESLDGLGTILALQGDLAGARGGHERAFAIFQRVEDPSLAAASLTALSEVAARLGDVRASWQSSTRALLAQRQAGDRVGVARILGSRAQLAYDRGDLATARNLAEDQLRLARQTGARFLDAWALRNLGRIAFAAGDLDGALKMFQEALETSSSLGANLLAAEIRVDLASLALESGQAGQAALRAREAAAWYRSRGIAGGEALALTVLGEALLAQGLRGDAIHAEAAARARLEASHDLELRLELAGSLARLAAAAGRTGEAVRDLRQAIQEAERLGLVLPALEARLALGQILRGMGDPAGAALLQEVRRNAGARGLKRLAELAAGPPLTVAPPARPSRLG